MTRTQVSGFELSGRLIMHSDEPACPIIRESRLSFIKENEFSSSRGEEFEYWPEFKLTESGAYPGFLTTVNDRLSAATRISAAPKIK